MPTSSLILLKFKWSCRIEECRTDGLTDWVTDKFRLSVVRLDRGHAPVLDHSVLQCELLSSTFIVNWTGGISLNRNLSVILKFLEKSTGYRVQLDLLQISYYYSSYTTASLWHSWWPPRGRVRETALVKGLYPTKRQQVKMKPHMHEDNESDIPQIINNAEATQWSNIREKRRVSSGGGSNIYRFIRLSQHNNSRSIIKDFSKPVGAIQASFFKWYLWLPHRDLPCPDFCLILGIGCFEMNVK